MKNNIFLQNIMGGLGSLDHFLQKNLYYLTKYAIKMQYIGGVYENSSYYVQITMYIC